jgi:2-methylisocitrate lyase-like PEP mutase family enzyme
MSKVLRDLLTQDAVLTVPGCWDPFTALLAQRSKFSCVYLSGASLAYTRLGRSDVGLTNLSDVVDVTGNITDRIEIPLIVDIDDGYGNALNVQRTVRLVERAGAAAVQLEDQAAPKRCGHLTGKRLISRDEMVGKIKAATDARRNPETVLIARTDAIAVEGFDAAIDRAEAYLEAGCDVLFIEAPETRDQMKAIGARFGRRVPLLANMVEGGSTPSATLEELHDINFRIALYPGGLARAFAFAAREFFDSLKTHGTTEPFRSRMEDFKGLNSIIGTPELLELGKKYDPDSWKAK